MAEAALWDPGAGLRGRDLSGPRAPSVSSRRRLHTRVPTGRTCSRQRRPRRGCSPGSHRGAHVWTGPLAHSTLRLARRWPPVASETRGPGPGHGLMPSRRELPGARRQAPTHLPARSPPRRVAGGCGSSSTLISGSGAAEVSALRPLIGHTPSGRQPSGRHPVHSHHSEPGVGSKAQLQEASQMLSGRRLGHRLHGMSRAAHGTSDGTGGKGSAG